MQTVPSYLFLAAILATPPSSQSSAPALDDLLEIARRDSPSLAASSARVEAARARAVEAGSRPDPEFEASLQDASFPSWTIGREEMSMLGGGWRQEWLSPQRQRARVAAANAEVDDLGARARRQQRQLQLAIATEYAELFAIDHQLETLAATGDELRGFERIALDRYAANSGTELDLLALRLGLVRLEQRREELRADRSIRTARLDSLLGRSEPGEWGRFESLPELTFPTATSGEPAERATALADLKAAEQRKLVALSELKPIWSTGAGWFWRDGLAPVATLQLGVRWPTQRAKKQLQEVAAAEAERSAAERELRGLELQLAARRRELRARYDVAVAAELRQREGVVPLLSESLASARDAYVAGGGALPTLLEFSSARKDALLESFRQAALQFELVFEAAALLGEEQL